MEGLDAGAVPQEFSFRQDELQLRFRQMRSEWIAMGRGVDPAATVGPHGSLWR